MAYHLFRHISQHNTVNFEELQISITISSPSFSRSRPAVHPHSSVRCVHRVFVGEEPVLQSKHKQ
jgi:hypothetical protein